MPTVPFDQLRAVATAANALYSNGGNALEQIFKQGSSDIQD